MKEPERYAMHSLDLTFDHAGHNLACDEALLDLCEDHSNGEILRFWEPQQHFVVLGYSNKTGAEVAITSCRAEGIPVLRRPSGGGAVLQGPGCLNYSLILDTQAQPELKNLTQTNTFVLERHRQALNPLLHNTRNFSCHSERQDDTGIQVRGISDLALGGLKVSGNAQRRRRRYILFHGTFLLADFDLALIPRYLAMPSRQPDYRKNRAHQDFVTRLPLSAAQIKQALCHIWNAHTPLAESVIPRASIDALVESRYSRDSWNSKF